jgi:hypothetical protein
MGAAHFGDQSWQADDPGKQPHMVKPNPTPPNQQAITQIRQPVATVVVKKQSTAPTSSKRGTDHDSSARTGNNGNSGKGGNNNSHGDGGGHGSHGGNRGNDGGHHH